MREGFNRVIAVAAVLLPLLFSCVRPSSDEVFVKASECNGQGFFVFPVAMDDSSCTYSLSFIVPLACRDDVFESFAGTEAEVVLVAPSGQRYYETVSFGPEALSCHEWDRKTLAVPYREGLVPVEHGIWTMYVSLDEDFKRRYSLEGIGMSLVRGHEVRRSPSAMNGRKWPLNL